jgi:ankyrin repeat protein
MYGEGENTFIRLRKAIDRSSRASNATQKKQHGFHRNFREAVPDSTSDDGEPVSVRASNSDSYNNQTAIVKEASSGSKFPQWPKEKPFIRLSYILDIILPQREILKVIRNKDKEKFAYLIDRGVKVSRSGKSAALAEAVECGQNNIILLLLMNGADANAWIRNQFTYTVLHRAVMRGDHAAVKILLYYGADIHARISETNSLGFPVDADFKVR